MLISHYLFIFCLSLAAACGSDNKTRDENITDTTALETEANREEKQVREQEDNQPQDTLYQISGTEPFWSMVVAKPQIRFQSMDGDTLLFDYQAPRQASARPADYVQVFELEGQQQLVLRKTTDCPCSDGMSSKEYPYQATLILKNKVLEGCGRTP